MTRPPRPGARRRTVLSALSAGALAGLAGCADTDDGEDTAATATMTDTATTDIDETTTEAEDSEDQSDREPATPTWTTGTKYGVGTVADHGATASRTWFTLTDGALTEPRFPRVDCLNAGHVSFVVTDQEGYVAHTHVPPEVDDTVERAVEPTTAEALAWRQTATETDDAYDWRLAVEHVADPDRDALVLDVEFEASDALSLFVLATPTPSGRAAHTAGQRRAHPEGATDGSVLTATETGADGVAVRDSDDEPVVVSLALAADAGGFADAAVLEAASEASEDFAGSGVLPDTDDDQSPGTDAAEGVLELVGELAADATAASRTVALGFAEDGDAVAASDVAAAAAASGFERAREGYVASWREYLADVVVPDSVAGDDDLAAQYNAAAMVLKAVEDKTYRGASIASPSVPWGSRVSARDAGDHGYNFVWARDLYQVFTAFDALGDPESAAEHLEYVFAYQHDGDGFLPQNTWIDGRTRWGGEQLDEIAFPLVMVDQLRRRHDYGLADAGYDYAAPRAMAEYLVHGGPRTEQERWEEEDGFSPSTVAATVAGLAAAARLAESEGRADDALVYRAVADHWQRSVVDWTATTTGVDPDGDLAAADREHGGSGRAPSPEAATPYFLRVTDDADPDDGAGRSLANGGPTLDERGIVDAGFLELVRLGVLPHDHSVVENSLSVVDDTIRVDTPNGPAWYRYNGDGYGEVGVDGDSVDAGTPWSVTHAGRGRLWPILTGERAEYELLAGTESGDLAPERLLDAMAAFANDGRMIPEQVWDREDSTAYGWAFGEGTASATPLAWSMAGFVRLARSLDAGTPVERPRATASRYVDDGGAPEPPALSVDWPDSVVDTAEVELAGETEAVTLLVRTPQETVRVDPGDGSFAATIPLESGRNPITVVAAADGASRERGLAAAQRTISYVE
ncbi:glycoside hydrolase family 15 protein [Halorubellus salinus]|uniref:glycoside hydrolase family 15 protein n=1 Tax=Halorubellus salinus TaxID=755309 RepID=UPI001D07CF86|nr:glycoside hydrolase family 15 protein [Halorubellus salinus]